MSKVRLYFASFLLLIAIHLTACNGRTEQKLNQLNRYQIRIIPDSVILGKNQEVFLAIKNLKAADVKNIPQNDTSIEVTYDLEVTNNNPINGEHVFVNPSNFRLVLDNHHKLTHAFYNSLGADPQSTTISVGNVFNLPAGTKPVTLNLFYADSVVSLKIYLN